MERVRKSNQRRIELFFDNQFDEVSFHLALEKGAQMAKLEERKCINKPGFKKEESDHHFFKDIYFCKKDLKDKSEMDEIPSLHKAAVSYKVYL